MSDLSKSNEILNDYPKENSLIDSGNLYFAGATYRDAFINLTDKYCELSDKYVDRIEKCIELKNEITKIKKSREVLRKACEDEKNIYPRFWSKVKVKRKNECWEWQSSISPQGYGKFSIDNYPYSAHVISYKYFNNDHDKNLVIDHICMNKKCVNPNHLRQVNYFISNTENTNGFAYINSKKKSCKNGHKFTNENTIIRKNKSGRAYRKCKKCRTIENKRAKAREAIKADDEIMWDE